MFRGRKIKLLIGFTSLLLLVIISVTVTITWDRERILQANATETMQDQLKIYEPFYLNDSLLTDQFNKKVKENADKLLNNKLVVNEKITDEVPYNINNIDWDMSETASPNTFSLYLHTLSPVYYLSKTYVETKDIRYLKAADKFVDSWYQYASSQNKLNRYTWYDHSVAERTENLIYYSIVKQATNNGKLDKSISELINLHAEWLYEDNNYTPKHNHGIFEDGSLIKAGYFLNKPSYIQKGTDRLDQQLKYAFPNGHIHIENSFGYHLGIVSYIKSIAEFLIQFDDPYSDTANAYYKGAVDYLVYVYKPNLSAPYLGDTIGAEESASIIKSDFNDEKLKYVQTKGLEGTKPEETMKVYLNDGTAIYREHWDKENYDQATWLLFKSGFLSSTHKHADDLSFLLYSKGHDIFIDPGMYNYMVGNKFHDYMNSTYAHNTVVVDNQSYSVSMFNSNKVGLHSYQKNAGYFSVTGFNNIYSGVSIDRTINYIDGNNFLIVDDIHSKETHNYSQIFHLSNDVEVIELSTDQLILKIKDTDYYLLLQQLTHIDSVDKFTGDEDQRILSFTSNGLNKVAPSTTVVFRKSDKDTKFITFLKIIKAETLKNSIFDKPTIKDNTVDINNVRVKIIERERLPETKISASFDNNKLKVENLATSDVQKLSYSFYLLDKESGKKFDSRSYSIENSAVFDLEKGNAYALISYLRNNAKETSKKLTGFIEFDGNRYLYKEVPDQEQEPKIKGASLKKLGKNAYNFSVIISGTHGLTSKWYIYKDGASYDFIANNSNELNYEFKEPGKYTCIYRINDKYFGEVEYNNFEEIEINLNFESP